MGLKEAKGPLRRVLGTFSLPVGITTGIKSTVETGQEVYECGHVALPKSDIYGETNAVKRRCRFCRDGKPPHVDVNRYK
jgi:hypothetical protein